MVVFYSPHWLIILLLLLLLLLFLLLFYSVHIESTTLYIFIV